MSAELSAGLALFTSAEHDTLDGAEGSGSSAARYDAQGVALLSVGVFSSGLLNQAQELILTRRGN